MKFEKKLEQIASRNLGIDAMAPLEGFQNKIIREKEVIGRMLQRIRMKRKIIQTTDMSEELDGRLRNQQTSLKDDMKMYIKLHYELKEDLIEEWEERDVLSISECTNCSVRLACGGGCAAIAKSRTGKLHSPDCRPIKELLELGISLYNE